MCVKLSRDGLTRLSRGDVLRSAELMKSVV